MSSLQLHKKENILFPIKIKLPASKSLSNRYLILQALSKEKFHINNLSEAHDTSLLQNLLLNFQDRRDIDVEDAGTVARFMTAFLACQRGEWQIYGSNRMHQRPIKPLVDALTHMGANIKYLGNKGYMPLLIRGNRLNGDSVPLEVSQSSQFLSALLLISPTLNKLNISFSSPPISRPYIIMTLEIIKSFGIDSIFTENKIETKKIKAEITNINIESDWSAAAFWYSCVALSKDKNICLQINGLYQTSLQGDRKVADFFKLLGVKTTFLKQGIEIKKGHKVSPCIKLNLRNQPDLAQSIIVTAAALGLEGEFTGLQSLKLKETDRIKAIINELQKLNISISSNNKDKITLSKNKKIRVGTKAIQTYQDHRMAMAFSPLSLILNNIKIQNPNVVKKSYPEFWSEMMKIINLKIISD